jgi:hypothetical protein
MLPNSRRCSIRVVVSPTLDELLTILPQDSSNKNAGDDADAGTARLLSFPPRGLESLSLPSFGHLSLTEAEAADAIASHVMSGQAVSAAAKALDCRCAAHVLQCGSPVLVSSASNQQAH